MVKTGARATRLRTLFVRIGYQATASPPRPRLSDLTPERLDDVLELYRTLGGENPTPQLRPGGWDLAFDNGLVVELDEELHFNRYRRTTLEAGWANVLPWHRDYLAFTLDNEDRCLSAGQWGKRWTSPSCEALFGSGDPPGIFAVHGAPRWKQRALYDAMKDAAALDAPDFSLVRLATVDRVGDVQLGDALSRRAEIDLDALRLLIEQRST